MRFNPNKFIVNHFVYDKVVTCAKVLMRWKSAMWLWQKIAQIEYSTDLWQG